MCVVALGGVVWDDHEPACGANRNVNRKKSCNLIYTSAHKTFYIIIVDSNSHIITCIYCRKNLFFKTIVMYKNKQFHRIFQSYVDTRMYMYLY